MTDAAADLNRLLDAVHRLSGADFRSYRHPPLLRRVQWRIDEEGLASIDELVARIERDPECLCRLRRSLTLHATSMFRDPGLFKVLRRQMGLLHTFAYPRLWVAACSTGEELYSLLIVLHEEGLLSRSTVFATDLSADVIADARRGHIDDACWADYQIAYRQAGGKGDLSHYFSPAGLTEWSLHRALFESVVFDVHDLLSGASFNEFQLVMCRNVLMYLDERAQSRVLRLLHESLSPLGVLCLGMGESLTRSPNLHDYALLDAAEPVYRRLR